MIYADDANAWTDYFCPTCKADVFLRAGKKRERHFAHMPRQGKPECENFHPSNDLLRPGRFPTIPIESTPVESLRLSLELEADYNARRGPRKWRLCLTVPKSPDGNGKLTFDFGGGDARTIALSKLMLQAQTYQVDPDTDEFGAKWISPDVRPAYRTAVQQRIAGLARNSLNVFAAARQKLKPQARSLSWGASCYFIWHNSIVPRFPPGLIDHELATDRAWCCALAILPLTPDAEIESWLADTCDRQILRPKREWALAYPPAYGLDDDGSHQIHSNAEILLAIKAIEESAGDEVTCATRQGTASAALSGAGQHLFEISSPKPPAPKAVYLGWDNEHIVTLTERPNQDPFIEPVVALTFNEAGTIFDAPLHNARCQRLLSKVRAGSLELQAVHQHPLLIGEMRYRPAGTLDWVVQSLPTIAHNVPTSNKLPLSPGALVAIQEALRDTAVDISLDFGAFGRFDAAGVTVEGTQDVARAIPRDLRALIKWLSNASGVFAPLGEDEALLRNFEALAVPARLAAHKRAIEQQIYSATASRIAP